MGFKFLLKSNLNLLPKNPGVYVFKDEGKILYIGKAANIRERVKNHFPSRSEGKRRTNVLRTHQPTYRDNLFINQVSKIGYLKTGSEIEALILEANLIKKYQPKYNIVWRDDKNYFYAGITKENYPRVFITHQPATLLTKSQIPNSKFQKNSKSQIPNAKPIYIGPFVDGNALKQTLKVLRKVFPFRSCKTLPKRPCLWYQLDRCPGPCLLKTKNYGNRISIILKKSVGNECQRNAKNLLKFLNQGRQQVLKDLKKEMQRVSTLEHFEKAAKIRDQIKALERVVSHTRIFEPQLFQKINWPQIQKTLQKILNKGGRPAKASRQARRAPVLGWAAGRIEAYDISNIQGKLATGSMVTFIDGKANKNFYRKFKIRITQKPNDVLMLKECLIRRIKHLEWPFPDLILIDGGKAQLNAALSALNQHKSVKSASISVLALAKNRNKLYIEGRKKPIFLKTLPREIFNLILQLRDEAHRFASTYHKKLREIDTFN